MVTLYMEKLIIHAKIELVQHNACLAITGAIRGTSKEKLSESFFRSRVPSTPSLVQKINLLSQILQK